MSLLGSGGVAKKPNTARLLVLSFPESCQMTHGLAGEQEVMKHGN